MKTLIGAALSVLLCGAAPAMADHDRRERGVNARQHRIEQRVENGFRSGELTRREYRRLQYGLREVEHAQHYYRADGFLSPQEREDLHLRLDYLAGEVARERHDGERRHESYNRDYRADRR